MTILEAINRQDGLRSNAYSVAQKVAWLSQVDAMVKQQIIDTHEGGENIAFSDYTTETPTDTVLLVPHPHDEMYLRFMEAQIGYHNGEIKKYNNAMALFNADFEAFAKHYKSTHMPKSRGTRFLF